MKRDGSVAAVIGPTSNITALIERRYRTRRSRLQDLLIIVDHLRCSFFHFELGADFLDLRCLLFETCSEGFNLPLLLRDS
jgi:hypothetical protein